MLMSYGYLKTQNIICPVGAFAQIYTDIVMQLFTKCTDNLAVVDSQRDCHKSYL